MKITFNKFSVLLMYLMITALLVYVLITKEYPPTSFIIAYFGFWICQSIVTAKLYTSKKQREDDAITKKTMLDAAMEAMKPYINEENASEICEKYLGIDLTKTKKGSKKK